MDRGIKKDFRPPIALFLLHTRHASSASPRFIVKTVLGLVDNEWNSELPITGNALYHMRGYPVWLALCDFRQYINAVEVFSRGDFRVETDALWAFSESRKHFGPCFRMGSFGHCPLITSMRPCYGGQSGLRKGRENEICSQAVFYLWKFARCSIISAIGETAASVWVSEAWLAAHESGPCKSILLSACFKEDEIEICQRILRHDPNDLGQMISIGITHNFKDSSI